MIKLISGDLFNAQFLRILGGVNHQTADMGECFSVSQRIKPGNYLSWYEQWSAQADKNYSDAEKYLSHGNTIDSCRNFLRASTYYRSAYFFLEGDPTDKRIQAALDNSIASFNQAIKLIPYKIKTVTIPYNNTTLPGYLYLQPSDEKPRPIIITCAGGDGTKEEFLRIAEEAYKRGFHCLTFEGPGQGSVLRKQQLTFTPIWEDVARQVIDYLCKNPEIDQKNIIYMGISFGGFLAARAITKEKRIRACILDPGQFDMISNLKNKFSKLFPDKPLNQVLEKVLSNSNDPDTAFIFNSRLMRFGCDSVKALCEKLSEYTLEGRVENISCPVLVFDNEEEYLSKGQAKYLYDKLQCEKKYHFFKASEETGGHCEPLSSPVFSQHAFNWLNTLSRRS